MDKTALNLFYKPAESQPVGKLPGKATGRIQIINYLTQKSSNLHALGALSKFVSTATKIMNENPGRKSAYMSNYCSWLAVSGCLVLASGCGGSGEARQGVFLDSAVSGLAYSTETLSGITDAEGTYEYLEGESVTFSIGGLQFPTVVATETVTPLELAGTNDPFDSGVVNVVRLLQTLDHDSDPSNGIEISAETRERVQLPVIDLVADFTTVDGVLGSIVSQAYPESRPVVTASVATEHFIDTLTLASDSEQAEITVDQRYYVREGDLEFDNHWLALGDDSFSTNLPRLASSGSAVTRNGVYQLNSNGETLFLSKKEADGYTGFCLAQRPLDVDQCGVASRLFRLFNTEDAAIAFTPAEEDLEIGAAEEQSEAGASEAELGASESQPESSESELDSTESEPDQGIVQPVVATPEPATGTGTATASNTGDLLTPEDLFPKCIGDVEDSDGDGYGWENGATCLLGSTDTSNATTGEPANNLLTPEDLFPLCVGSVVDDNGDGYAWENGKTCLVGSNVTTTPDPVTETPVTAVGLDQITDLIFVTGQSNAAGLQTAYDAELDAVDQKVFAFTDEGWQVADLHQFWDEGIPGNFSQQLTDRDPYNNVLFQVGKSISAKTDRVVGLVLLTAPGEGISHWDYNSEFFTRMRNHALAALNSLPNKSTFDSVIWLQGETDWLFEGTADTGATGFSAIDSDFYRNYYPNKLVQLVSNFRSEGWFGPDGRFICAETKKAGLNPHLMALNFDADSKTGCAAAADLPIRDTDPYGNHFSAEGLRTLGSRIADIYLSMP